MLNFGARSFIGMIASVSGVCKVLNIMINQSKYLLHSVEIRFKRFYCLPAHPMLTRPLVIHNDWPPPIRNHFIPTYHHIELFHSLQDNLNDFPSQLYFAINYSIMYKLIPNCPAKLSVVLFICTSGTGKTIPKISHHKD
jgi:hypothetical protein